MDEDEYTQVQVTFSLQEFTDMVTVLAEGIRTMPIDSVPPIAWQLLNEHLRPNGGSDSGATANGETGPSESAAILRGL